MRMLCVFLLLSLLLVDARDDNPMACPDGMELFSLDHDSLLDMRADAEESDDANKPFFRVQFEPNYENYDDLASLAGMSRSGSLIFGTAWDAYHIQANSRESLFILKGVSVFTRYARNIIIEFYERQEGILRLQRIGVDKVSPWKNQTRIFTRSNFPSREFDGSMYEQPVEKIRIGFRTLAGRNDFLVQNLRVFACIGSRLV